MSASRRGHRKRQQRRAREQRRRLVETCYVCGDRRRGGFVTRRGERVCRSVQACTERVFNPPPPPKAGYTLADLEAMRWSNAVRFATNVSTAAQQAGKAFTEQFAPAIRDLADAADKFAKIELPPAGFALPDGFKPLGCIGDEGIT